MKLTSSKTILAVGIPVVLLGWFFYGRVGLSMEVLSSWGQWGDGFGALNTLFTGIGLVGILATLAHQREEVKEAKEDLSKVLTALKETAAAMNHAARVAALTAAINYDREDLRCAQNPNSVVEAMSLEAQAEMNRRHSNNIEALHAVIGHGATPS